MTSLYVDYTYWIDACPIDGNLLASGGIAEKVKIFDKRELNIVKTFENIHSSKEANPVIRNSVAVFNIFLFI